MNLERQREFLARTLEIFGPNGEHWTKGTLDDGNGNHCLIGGIRAAAGDGHILKDVDYQGARQRVVDAITKRGTGLGPMGWNDAWVRKFEDVKEVINEAIASYTTKGE